MRQRLQHQLHIFLATFPHQYQHKWRSSFCPFRAVPIVTNHAGLANTKLRVQVPPRFPSRRNFRANVVIVTSFQWLWEMLILSHEAILADIMIYFLVQVFLTMCNINSFSLNILVIVLHLLEYWLLFCSYLTKILSSVALLIKFLPVCSVHDLMQF